MAAPEAAPSTWLLNVAVASSRYFITERTESASNSVDGFDNGAERCAPSTRAAAMGTQSTVPKLLRWNGPDVELEAISLSELEHVVQRMWRVSCFGA